MTFIRLAPACLATLLAGCAGMVNWDQPVERMGAGDPLREAPQERPMELTPESYRVTKGDTLFSIAFRNNLDYRELARWNGIGADFRILPGQLLQLTPPTTTAATPVVDAGAVVAAAVTPTPAPVVPTPMVTPPLSTSASAPAPVPVPAPASGPVAATATAAAAPRPGSTGWLWPTEGTILRKYAPSQGVRGIDFTGKLGQPVYAAAAGKVVYSGNALKGYGELIIIKHDDTHLSAYGYNRRRHVAEGDSVKAGQTIGELGTGPENKPLLHFEIRERGKPVNPATYLPPRP